MATISSHVLDAIQGCSAAGIRVVLERVVEEHSDTTMTSISRHTVFDVIANEEGRIAQEVTIETPSAYELVFYSAEYFKAQGTHPTGRQIIEQAVVRLSLPDPEERYHIPVIISPHSYSLWWSE